MNRRDFIKGAAFTAAMMSSGVALATEYEEKGSAQQDTNLLRLQNRENPTAMEQKHVPGIEAPN
ncbi:MAG: twin-arginine translocation signal domain-containing protein, partial [Proteobacteria bacterium]|nr:twin-arginine translocation signal domain-containing protein [Pseudomonadota bacterium]